jgi:hypothetical protein
MNQAASISSPIIVGLQQQQRVDDRRQMQADHSLPPPPDHDPDHDHHDNHQQQQQQHHHHHYHHQQQQQQQEQQHDHHQHHHQPRQMQQHYTHQMRNLGQHINNIPASWISSSSWKYQNHQHNHDTSGNCNRANYNSNNYQRMMFAAGPLIQYNYACGGSSNATSGVVHNPSSINCGSSSMMMIDPSSINCGSSSINCTSPSPSRLRSLRAPRMRWTSSLHAHFVHAVDLLGGHERNR